MTEDWKYMMDFVDELLKHAEMHQENNSNLTDYVSKRISIIHFDHALELIMKAYLMKNKYVIYDENEKIVRNGIKEDESISKLLNKEKTFGFVKILDIFTNNSRITASEKKTIIKFHRFRNEIQHRSLLFNIDKSKELEEIQPIIRSVYEKVCADTNRKCPLRPNAV